MLLTYYYRNVIFSNESLIFNFAVDGEKGYIIGVAGVNGENKCIKVRKRVVENCNNYRIGCFLDLRGPGDTWGPAICGTTRPL